MDERDQLIATLRRSNQALVDAYTNAMVDQRAVLRWELFEFVLVMEKKLRENDHKEGSDQNPNRLWSGILEESEELRDAMVDFNLDQGPLDAVLLETADVANFAFLLYRALRKENS